MTADRNGWFRRAAMRLATVAEFAAAWFAGTAAAHAVEQQETPSEPAVAFGHAHAAGGPAHLVSAAEDTGQDRVGAPVPDHHAARCLTGPRTCSAW
jgi:hypothetical protein